MMTLRRTQPKIALIQVAAVLLLAMGLATALDSFRSSPAEPAAVQRTFDRRPAGERAAEHARNRLATAPGDPRALARLASAYLLRARETGDPTYYSQADELLQNALAAAGPDEFDVLATAGSLALSRHQFADALDWGERAVAVAPDRAAGYGVLTDALVELGLYEEAVIAAQRMVDLRPDQPSLSRVSYLRELHGDLPGAIEAMRQAIQAGAPDGEATAWSEVHLGHLLFATGDLDGAARAYQNATRRVERYVYGVAGLARVRAARGDLIGAAGVYQQAAERMPLPELVIALGDTYARLGDDARAQQQYELVGAIQRLLAANGVRTDIDIALFDADHDIKLESALEMAQLEYEARKSVQVADTLAWVEYKLGDIDSALIHSQEALRLGTRDPLMLFRAGVIAQSGGDPERAYTLLSSVNPSFSILWADDLAARLSELSKTGAQP